MWLSTLINRITKSYNLISKLYKPGISLVFQLCWLWTTNGNDISIRSYESSKFGCMEDPACFTNTTTYTIKQILLATTYMYVHTHYFNVSWYCRVNSKSLIAINVVPCVMWLPKLSGANKFLWVKRVRQPLSGLQVFKHIIIWGHTHSLENRKKVYRSPYRKLHPYSCILVSG